MLQIASPIYVVRHVPWTRLRFWIRRYLPAEILGTAVMLLAGNVAMLLEAATPVIALAAILGECIGFYSVMAVTVYREQRSATGTTTSRATLLRRIMTLLLAEFGLTELLDLAIVRPALLFGSVVLVGNVNAGLILGKVLADLVFYVVAAIAFTITVRMRLRGNPASGLDAELRDRASA